MAVEAVWLPPVFKALIFSLAVAGGGGGRGNQGEIDVVIVASLFFV